MSEKDYESRLSANEMLAFVESRHRSPSDLYDGDLGDRITNYPSFQLKEVPFNEIEEGEWEVYEEDVSSFSSRLESGEEPPPVVLAQKYRGSRSVIDGTHRLEALRRRGRESAWAYIPELE